MKFTLEIELGNDARDYSDVIDTLEAVVFRLRERDSIDIGNTDRGIIPASNGNSVGKWEVQP